MLIRSPITITVNGFVPPVIFNITVSHSLTCCLLNETVKFEDVEEVRQSVVPPDSYHTKTRAKNEYDYEFTSRLINGIN